MGRNADALTNYRDAAASSDRRSAAAGRLHEIMLRYIRPTPTRPDKKLGATRDHQRQARAAMVGREGRPHAYRIDPGAERDHCSLARAAASLSLTQYSVIAGLDPAIHDEPQRYVDHCQAGYGQYF